MVVIVVMRRAVADRNKLLLWFLSDVMFLYQKEISNLKPLHANHNKTQLKAK